MSCATCLSVPVPSSRSSAPGPAVRGVQHAAKLGAPMPLERVQGTAQLFGQLAHSTGSPRCLQGLGQQALLGLGPARIGPLPKPQAQATPFHGAAGTAQPPRDLCIRLPAHQAVLGFRPVPERADKPRFPTASAGPARRQGDGPNAWPLAHPAGVPANGPRPRSRMARGALCRKGRSPAAAPPANAVCWRGLQAFWRVRKWSASQLSLNIQNNALRQSELRNPVKRHPVDPVPQNDDPS